MQTILALSIVILSISNSAAAQTVDEAGTLILSVDRLFGLSWTAQTTTSSESSRAGGSFELEDTEYAISLSLLGQSPINSAVSVYGAPRLNIDYLVTNGFSVGGGMAISTVSRESELSFDGETMTVDGPTSFGFLFAPRVGFVFAASETIAIWPRAGFSFLHMGAEAESNDGDFVLSSSVDLFSLTGEFVLMLMPMNGIAFTLTLSADQSVSGERESSERQVGFEDETTTDDISSTEIGLQGGLAAWF